MKRLLIFSFLSLMTMTIWAQSGPFNYQSVIRDASNNVLANQNVSLRFTFQNAGGTIYYQETLNVTTTALGMVNHQICTGTPVQGSCAMPWGQDDISLKIEVDVNGGSNYSDYGTQTILPVPLANWADIAEVVLNDAVDDADADPANEIQTLSKNGSTISLSNGGGSVLDETIDADADPTNELQTLSKSGNMISLSDGGVVEDAVDDADADPENELQTPVFDSNTRELYLTGRPNNKVVIPGGAGGANFWQLNNNSITPINNYRTIFGDPASTQWSYDASGLIQHWEAGQQTAISGYMDGRYFQQIDGDLFSQYFKTDSTHVQQMFGPVNQTGPQVVSIAGQTFSSNVLAAPIGVVGVINSIGFNDMTTLARSDVYAPNNASVAGMVSNGGSPFIYTADPTTGNLFTGATGGTGVGGIMRTYNGSGNQNTYIGPDGGTLNGSFYLADNTSVRGGMTIDAQNRVVVIKDVSNFRIDHPLAEDKELWYACIEGPEVAAYERGVAQLREGECFVPFSEHFSAIIDPTSITVILTPQSADSKGLAVVEKRFDGFVVKELYQGQGEYAFDWEAKAVRSGYEDYKAVRPKSQGPRALNMKSPSNLVNKHQVNE